MEIEKEEIYNYLNKQYNFLTNIYNQENILGLFVLGKVNYGFAKDINDVESLMIYLPSLEEVCCVAPVETHVLYGPTNKMIEIVDLRKLLGWAFEQNGDLMEALFTDYHIINPRYEHIFTDKLINPRELIFRYNEQKRIRYAVERAEAALDDYQATQNKDSLFEGYRLYLAASLYVEGIKIKDCINITNDLYREYLTGIIDGSIKPNIKITRDRLKVIVGKALNLPGNPQAESLIKDAISSIMKMALTSTSSAREFYQTLTATEKEAYKIIVTRLDNGEGDISLSQLLNESEISRPVFKNVLQKLESNGIAEVINRGSKGTSIKFIDKSYLLDNN